MATDSHGMGIPLPADSTKIHEFPAVAREGFEKVAEVMAKGATEGMNTAAKAAINAAMDNADLVGGDDPRLPAITTTKDHLAVVLDAGGRETWLGARASDGGPTPWAVEHMQRRLGVGPRETADNYLFAVTDTAGRLTDLSVRAADGQFPEFVVERLRRRILAGATLPGTGTGTAPARTYADTLWDPDSEIWPARADPKNVTGWGSSSMEGMHGEFTEFFAAKGATFHTQGMGGEWAEHTAARMGSVPALVAPVGGKIPASGPVDTSVANMRTHTSRPYTGTLAGVHGTLAYSAAANRYVFTRTKSGSAVTVPPNTPLIPDAIIRRGDTVLLWMGKNNVRVGDFAEDVIRITDASFDWLAPLAKRCLVLGHFNNCWDPADNPMRARIAAVHAAHRRRYGPLFVDVSAYLTGEQVWTDTGITPTANDRTAQALGNLPPSLALPDGGHVNAAGNAALVRHVIEPKLSALSWY